MIPSPCHGRCPVALTSASFSVTLVHHVRVAPCRPCGQGKPLLTAMRILITAILFATGIALPSLCHGGGPSDETRGNQNPLISSVRLEPSDCVKCHASIVKAYNENGKAHQSKITCIDCHRGHPPAVRDVIPLCSQCHSGKAHFDLKNCLSCHANPHTPLNLRLTRTLTSECTTCHEGQIKQLQANPSIHTTLACTACHTRHGFVPECFACHKGHLDTMTQADCTGCHPAHRPLVVSYTEKVPSEYCGSCHTAVYDLLARSHARHRNVACVLCHRNRHKAIPTCRDCHQPPHPESIIGKFPSCGSCHGKAHDLQLNQIDMRIENTQRAGATSTAPALP